MGKTRHACPMTGVIAALAFAMVALAPEPLKEKKSKRDILVDLGANCCEHVISGKPCEEYKIPPDNEESMRKMMHEHAQTHVDNDMQRAELSFCKKVEQFHKKMINKSEHAHMAQDCQAFVRHNDIVSALKSHMVAGPKMEL